MPLIFSWNRNLKIPFLGDTLNIPDSVMGITFLAAGTSVPEAVSSVIVAKQGKKCISLSYNPKKLIFFEFFLFKVTVQWA